VKAEELAVLDQHELSDRLKTSRRELYELRFQVAVGQLENNRQIRKVKKDIARILTVIRSRELASYHEAPPAAVPAATSPSSGEESVAEAPSEEEEADE
jgi:large subunit ribosomal protein L29